MCVFCVCVCVYHIPLSVQKPFRLQHYQKKFLNSVASVGAAPVHGTYVLIATDKYWRHTIQWNPSNMDTLRPLKCVLIREVSSFHGCPLTEVPL